MSDLSIQPINSVQTGNAQFGRRNSGGGIPYYVSNVGLKTGALLSIPAIIDFLPDVRLNNAEYLEQSIENYKAETEAGKKNIGRIIKEHNLPDGCNNLLRRVQESIPDAEAYRKTCLRKCRIAIPATIIATGCTIGGGAVVDYVRNNRAKETAELGAKGNIEQLSASNNTQLSETGLPYYKSRIGKQLGALFGAGCGILSAFLNGGIARTAANMSIRAFAFALGGLAIGAIYDNVVNKRSEKAVNYIA